MEIISKPLNAIVFTRNAYYGINLIEYLTNVIKLFPVGGEHIYVYAEMGKAFSHLYVFK